MTSPQSTHGRLSISTLPTASTWRGTPCRLSVIVQGSVDNAAWRSRIELISDNRARERRHTERRLGRSSEQYSSVCRYRTAAAVSRNLLFPWVGRHSFAYLFVPACSPASAASSPLAASGGPSASPSFSTPRSLGPHGGLPPSRSTSHSLVDASLQGQPPSSA